MLEVPGIAVEPTRKFCPVDGQRQTRVRNLQQPKRASPIVQARARHAGVEWAYGIGPAEPACRGYMRDYSGKQPVAAAQAEIALPGGWATIGHSDCSSATVVVTAEYGLG